MKIKYFQILLCFCFFLQAACQKKLPLLSEEKDFSKEYIAGIISTNHLALTEEYISKFGNREEYIKVALESNSLEVLSYLLQNEFQEMHLGESPYFYVRSKEAFLLLQNNGYSPNVRNHQGKTLTEYYFEVKGREFFKFFLETATDLDLSSEKNLLFSSDILQDVELILLLQKRKADFASLDFQGNYPIYYAKDEQVLSLLLDVDYNMEHQNIKRENVLGEVYLRLQREGKRALAQKCLAKGVNFKYQSYGNLKEIYTK